jgi:hypothetical protein
LWIRIEVSNWRERLRRIGRKGKDGDGKEVEDLYKTKIKEVDGK